MIISDERGVISGVRWASGWPPSGAATTSRAAAWRLRAACQDTDPEVFYPGPGGHRQARLAKRVCADCPVRSECLDFAVRNGITDGIWGGLAVRERRGVASEAAPDWQWRGPEEEPPQFGCGHHRTEENTYRASDGIARCRICLSAKARRRTEKLQAAREAA